DKTILDTYGESTILKQRREDDDQKGPSDGSDRGSTTGSQSRQLSASESAFAEEPVQTTCQMEEPSHPVFETVPKINPLFKPLSILNVFPSQGDHHHRIVTGTKLCQLLKEMLSHG
nr:hypothetical protein [Tanacetum cinerariifolium]